METLEEKSLVIMDEPETYLHPPLISSYIRAISYLLIKKNAVAIVGTHSPVILQEVPKSCVWSIRRIGSETTVERLDSESFGEIKYNNRQVSFEFSTIVDQSEFLNLFSEIQNALHGKKMKIILDDDAEFYYFGRVTVNE